MSEGGYMCGWLRPLASDRTRLSLTDGSCSADIPGRRDPKGQGAAYDLQQVALTIILQGGAYAPETDPTNPFTGDTPGKLVKRRRSEMLVSHRAEKYEKSVDKLVITRMYPLTPSCRLICSQIRK